MTRANPSSALVKSCRGQLCTGLIVFLETKYGRRVPINASSTAVRYAVAAKRFSLGVPDLVPHWNTCLDRDALMRDTSRDKPGAAAEPFNPVLQPGFAAGRAEFPAREYHGAFGRTVFATRELVLEREIGRQR